MKPKQLVRHTSLHSAPSRDTSSFSERPSGSGTLRPPSINTAAGAASLQSQLRSPHWEPKFPFDLVIAYENEGTRARAFALCDHLVRALQDDHDIRQSWWKFPFLYDPQLLERATDVALAANMVILSLNHGKELPFIARTWVDGWIRQKEGHDSALVALVDNAPSSRCTDCPMLRHLNSAAHTAGMDFFPYAFAAPPLLAGSLGTDTAPGPNLVPLLEEILRRPNNASPWGINEY